MRTTLLHLCFGASAILLMAAAGQASTHYVTEPLQIDSFSISNGKKVFNANCAGCHGAAGQGSYGPNLCDQYWLHGAHYHNIVHIIKHGVSAKGMSAFNHKLKHHDVRDVAHYVMSLKGSNPSGAKAAEGKFHK
jgi:cytochrome c oxidase cbb3-type subunit 3